MGFQSNHSLQLSSADSLCPAFFHINDVHAHLDEFRSSGTDCTDKTKGCFGGYARVKTVVDQIRATVEDSLFLNVGDEFQVSVDSICEVQKALTI